MNTTTASRSRAVTTKIHPATKTKATRIKALIDRHRYKWHTYDHCLTAGENHMAACEMLANTMDWDGDWVGAMTDERSWCFVDIS